MSRGLPLDHAVRTTKRAVRAVVSPAGLRGSATELAWVAAHLAIYPLGVLNERRHEAHREDQERFTLADLPPLQRGLLMSDIVAAGTPIILVHGLVDNRSIFTLLRRGLRRRGFGRVLTLNYSPFTQDVRRVAAQLERLVELTCEQTGYERVHVIGHSLGGIVARYYVQRLGGGARVHTLVTLGSPHQGTGSAHLLPTRLARQLRPGSDLMNELAAPAPDCRTRVVAYWSDLDPLMVPKRTARLEHPDLVGRNVLVRGVGHMSLPINGQVVREITQLLAHLDTEGGTVTAGVTSLVPAPPHEASEVACTDAERPSVGHDSPLTAPKSPLTCGFV